ncbi:MAG: GntR family transcriptional regulator [Planctomycetes bacterium]|nr:GntR family transcriptional regulator [Planctomycetota bacterium]
MFGVRINRKLLKYELIIEEVREAILQKKLSHGDLLPSISKVSEAYGCARETVVKSFKILKEQGLIESLPSKGFFVSSENVTGLEKIFLLLNDLSPYMEVLHNAFAKELEGKAQVDVFFHHNNFQLFQQLVVDNSKRYHSYVIKPFAHPELEDVLKKIPSDDLLILDRRESVNDSRSYICQEFCEDFYMSLKIALPRIRRYNRLKLIYGQETRHPTDSITAYERFCQDFSLSGNLINTFQADALEKGDIYIVLSDDELVSVLSHCQSLGYALGKDVGVISYNETPLKAFVSGGITTISADYNRMGQEAAKFAYEKNKVQKFEFASLNIRNSL